MKDIWIEINGKPAVVCVEDGSGSAVVRGIRWRWSDHRYCGPLFLKKDGTDRKRQPGEKHPVWKAYTKWRKRFYGKEQ